jgi:hypothetical protein
MSWLGPTEDPRQLFESGRHFVVNFLCQWNFPMYIIIPFQGFVCMITVDELSESPISK